MPDNSHDSQHQRIHVRLDEVAQGQARTEAQIEELARNVTRTESMMKEDRAATQELIKENARSIAANAQQISQTQGMNRETNHKVERTLSKLEDVNQISKDATDIANGARSLADEIGINVRPVIQAHAEELKAKAENKTDIRKITLTILTFGLIAGIGWLGRAAYVYFTQGG